MSSSSTEKVTVSTVKTTTTTGCHMLKIEGYKMLRDSHGYGKCVDFPQFQAAGHSWSISFYPNGTRTIKSTVPIYVHSPVLFLKLHGAGDIDGGSVETNVKFSMVYARRRPWTAPHNQSSALTFSKREDQYWFSIIGRDKLESFWYIKHDGFAIRCDIAVVEKTAVLEPVVRPDDLEKLGMVCRCKDDMCKNHHVVSGGQRLKKAFFGCFRPN